MDSFEEQLEWLLNATGTKNRNQLAKHFGIHNSLVTKWERAGKIPEKYLLRAQNDILNAANSLKNNSISGSVVAAGTNAIAHAGDIRISRCAHSGAEVGEEMQELFELIREYASAATVKKLKAHMLKIKEISDGEI